MKLFPLITCLLMCACSSSNKITKSSRSELKLLKRRKVQRIHLTKSAPRRENLKRHSFLTPKKSKYLSYWVNQFSQKNKSRSS